MGKVLEGRHFHHIHHMEVVLQNTQEPEVEQGSSHLGAVVGRELMCLERSKKLMHLELGKMLVVVLDKKLCVVLNKEPVGELGKELVVELGKKLHMVVELGKNLVVELGKKLVVVLDKELVVDMHMQEEEEAE